MPIIAVCNQKGGCGKTTIAVNVAQAFALLDLRVLVVDMDPQASALDWAWEAKDFDVVAQGRIKPADLRRMRTLYDVALIDCPPQYAEPSAEAIRIADLVLVPVQPSQLDVWATQAIVDLIKVRQAVFRGKPQGGVRHVPRRPPYQALGAAA